jgi:thiol-disulfide isomerase/thioredoxin
MQQWTKNELNEKITTNNHVILYIFTSMCGTCQLASKMLNIVTELLPQLPIGEANIHELVDEAQEWQIESVPCLLIFNGEKIEQKIYAFHSVPYLYELLKKYQ